jgi:transposase InsO family protein
MHPEVKEEFRVRRLQVVFDIAAVRGGVRKLCREFGIAKSTYYYWKKRYELLGKSGLYRHKPIPYSSPRKTRPEVAEKVLELRNGYHMGPMKIVYYLRRYHDIEVSEPTVYRILKAHDISRMTRGNVKRTTHSKRYAKQVPGHHVQVDKFPFRIKTIRTYRGHEFQAKFHYHVEDAGMEHIYIKPMTPQLNGKVERSHRTDKDEFYQLLSYTDDIDLNVKLQAWEDYYNFDRPHFSHQGKTPYEVMKVLLEKSG